MGQTKSINMVFMGVYAIGSFCIWCHHFPEKAIDLIAIHRHNTGTFIHLLLHSLIACKILWLFTYYFNFLLVACRVLPGEEVPIRSSRVLFKPWQKDQQPLPYNCFILKCYRGHCSL